MVIRQETLAFLNGLAANNNREWFQAHKADYHLAMANFESVVDGLLQAMQAEEPELVGLTARDCVFRIYRDVRFSADKAPYKVHIAAAITPGGRKAVYPGYYFQVQPGGGSFLAGGLYRPPGQVLAAIRQEIDFNFETFRAIIEDPAFQKAFGGLWPDKLKTVPRGYHKSNPAIGYLKHKSFIVTYSLPDKVLTSNGMIENSMQVFRWMRGLNSFLSLPFADETLKPVLENLSGR